MRRIIKPRANPKPVTTSPFLALELKTDQTPEKSNEISPRQKGLEPPLQILPENDGSDPFLGTILPSKSSFSLRDSGLEASPTNRVSDCSSNLYQQDRLHTLAKPYINSLGQLFDCSSRLYQQKALGSVGHDRPQPSVNGRNRSSKEPIQAILGGVPVKEDVPTRLANDAHRPSSKRANARLSGLMVRGSTFYARWMFPRPLWEKIGKTHFVRSLRTKSAVEARKRLRSMAWEFESTIEQAQGLCEPHVPSSSLPLIKAIPARPVRGQKPFEAVFEQFLSDPTRQRTKKTIAGYRDGIEVIYSVIGRKTPIAGIDRDMCRRLLGTLQWLPTNSPKRFPTLSAVQAAKMAKEKGMTDLLGPVSINGYMMILSSIMNFAVNEEMVERNPCRGLRVIDPIKKKDKRLPFSDEQLRIIFNSPIYRSLDSATRMSAKFWVPLIGLFTGMRLNEICALDVADVQNIDGVICLAVRPSNDKSIKTDASERIVPVPKVLLQIGFGNLISAGLNARSKKLFPELLRSKNGHYSVEFSKWFGRHLRAIGAYRERTCFHSFRHCFRDALRQAETNQELALVLGGWTSELHSKNVHANYGRGYSIEILRDVIDGLRFSESCFIHLISI